MNHPFMIVGPCAAETEQQVLSTAKSVAQCACEHQHYHFVFRAGLWKPRTKPTTFQGIGADGLAWLQRVQRDLGLEVATEVATAEQAQLAMQAGMDYLWIGARTSANPIAVQTIVDAISEAKKHTVECAIKGVWIKNPVNEDAALWLGNVSRMETIGLPVMAIHRGCNHHPCWNMAYQLKKMRPDVPLIVDPSHLLGQADAIPQFCLSTQQLAPDGWMIETHICPNKALSDAQQQLSPSQLEHLLNRLETCASAETYELAWLRFMIDEVDDDLWSALANRMEVSKKIGVWKKENGIAVVQPARYQQVVNKRIEWGKEHGIDAEAVKQIMDAIHKESVRIQS